MDKGVCDLWDSLLDGRLFELKSTNWVGQVFSKSFHTRLGTYSSIRCSLALEIHSFYITMVLTNYVRPAFLLPERDATKRARGTSFVDKNCSSSCQAAEEIFGY